MEEKKLVPRKRFSGFKGIWDGRKFDQLVSRVSVSGKNKNLPQVEFEDIISGKGRLNKDIYQKKIDKKGILFTENDILFGKLRPYLKNWLLADFDGLAIGDFWVFRPLDSDSKFIYSLIQTNKYQSIANLSIGTKMPRSDWNTVSNTKYRVPTYQEQQKIGEFFKVLDERIANQELKIAKVKALKTAYLTEMFPQEGETVPKRRFKGFEEEWANELLSKISDVRDGTHESPKYYSEGYPFITSKNVSDGYINYDDIQYISEADFNQINKRSKVDINDILMGMIGTVGNIALIREEPYFAIKNVALIKDTKQVSQLYLYYFFQADYLKKQLIDGMDGGTQRFISLYKIRNLIILLPNKNEQQKIGQFFKNLDDQITTEEKRLEKLKKLKKAYLEEMFV